MVRRLLVVLVAVLSVAACGDAGANPPLLARSARTGAPPAPQPTDTPANLSAAGQGLPALLAEIDADLRTEGHAAAQPRRLADALVDEAGLRLQIDERLRLLSGPATVPPAMARFLAADAALETALQQQAAVQRAAMAPVALPPSLARLRSAAAVAAAALPELRQAANAG